MHFKKSWVVFTLEPGLLIFRGKKAKFSGIFIGKFAEKSADFEGKKVKIRGKIGRFRRVFTGEKSKFAEKSADFTGTFEGKLRQETISKKQPISLDFSFGQI